jgi:hydrogenase maturation protein HypF
VGFRPFIYHLARKYNLQGEVCNTNSGVTIQIECTRNDLERFMQDILKDCPVASRIKSVTYSEVPINGYTAFRIISSDSGNDGITEISPDIAVCPECMQDIEIQAHRRNYPLINCTRCGPRFTIVNDLPYDRSRTTMQDFPMCETCSNEYNDISDRRFHAQPVACNSCGPQYVLKEGEREVTSISEILSELASRIDQGEIIALKGQGGYHLLCDALRNESVLTLRARKGRDNKPFAVLFRDLQAVSEYCYQDDQEEALLTSWRRPIVLLQQMKPLAVAVNNGLGTIGALLPYMPFHHLVFKNLNQKALVLTSGNLSEDPIITDDDEAVKKLGQVTPLFIRYNREISNRTDDSVVRSVNGKVCMIRRSRGYVPEPLDLDCRVDSILAFGAEQKNTFCLGKGNQAIMSQHIGDLKGLETYDFYLYTLHKFMKLFRFTPELLVCDLHPGYLSTIHAEKLSEKFNIPLCKVQHHHAHVAACMAEHHLDEEVIGISMDGTGLGTDGHIWGGEFFVADRASFQRYTHFDYVPAPGGDKAVEEPWRMALSYLYRYPETRKLINKVPFFQSFDKNMLHQVEEMIDKEIHSPLTSGAGRLFDAVAVILGLCSRSSFDAEPPMRLESIIQDGIVEHYPFSADSVICFAPMLAAIIKDLTYNIPVPAISAKFHNTLVKVIGDISEQIRRERNLDKVVLSGGVFQNKYLLMKSVSYLESLNFRVYFNHQVPVSDGGISLGQLMIAAKKRLLCV